MTTQTSIKLSRCLCMSKQENTGQASFPMTLHYDDLPSGKNQNLRNSSKIIFPVGITLIMLTSVPLYYRLTVSTHLSLMESSHSSPVPLLSSSSSYDGVTNDSIKAGRKKKCDIFTGEWIPNPSAPYYTNETCLAIHEHQNCMKYGRPDVDFLKWRWKPDNCELPIFDPSRFLELVRGKSLAFVGDSVGRNQMQSLICLLSRVEYPVVISYSTDGQSTRWRYTSYNFTFENFWSPFLVKGKEVEQKIPALADLFNVYLDEFDENWTTKIEEFDYVIISAGHWFFRSSMYYEDKQPVGCHYCFNKNVTDLNISYNYKKAFRTAFRAINNLKNFKGITFLRTFAPSHFENGLWNEGGDCVRRKPFMSNETHLDGTNLELYMAQLEEFRIAEQEGEMKGLRFILLDTTHATLMRPDGHPSRYGHWPDEKVTMYNDCVHWCLPGPIDAWNDFLLELLEMERNGLLHGRQHLRGRQMEII